ncbi:MAG: NF038122 family metalloprotease [Stellaceae bacterium]
MGVLAGLAMGALLIVAPPAHALLITPTFTASITGNANAAAIEGAITTAINTIDGLYSNPVTIPVRFTYYNDGSTIASTTESYYYPSYDTYVNLLRADSLANPENTVLATAIANLAEGNDANGARNMAVVGAQLTMLGITAAPDATINLNSVWGPYSSFTTAVTSSQIDAIGGLEHELDEVLGGGGGGSGMNLFYDLEYGPTDLYRYSAPGTPSYTMSSGASS